MRIILFILFTIPLSSFGVGMDSCQLEGKIAGDKVTLKWIYIPDEKSEGFGLIDSPIYGFCYGEAKANSGWLISCAKKIHGKQTVYYESTNGIAYVCKLGCEKNVVKSFVLKCIDNDY